MAFMDDNFILSTGTAQHLFHGTAKDQAIVDYHCHLSPKDIADDRRFEDLTAIWLAGDHYKWRAMRANGVNEELITGAGSSPREKFQAWAETVPHTLRNPLFHWTHLELRRHFGITEILDGQSAQKIWDEANHQLQHSDLTARGILKKMKVEVVGTTDDPADSLDLHHAIAKSGCATRVVPTYRPDACLKVRQPERVQAWAKRLAAATGKGADTFAGLIAGLNQRHDDFAAAGCRATDHGLDYLPDVGCTEAEAKAIWERAIAGHAATLEESEKFAAFIMLHVGRLNHAKGWATQLHLGAVRDPNLGLLKRLGSDAGCDTIGDFRQSPGLIRWFGTLSGENALGKVILYNLNPADTALFACLPGSFQDGITPGKIQYGSGWWFLDQERGMRDQMNMLSDLGLLGRFIGMITDSRSFLSYPRHEYFRRILCDLVGQDVESGRIPDRKDWNERLVADVCYRNARQYFGFKA
jgi:glucuronate isomerase